MPRKGQKVKPDSLHAAGKLRPHCWITGLDPLKHEMYRPWQLAKAQANFRQEEWDFAFEDYYTLWLDHWSQRGRTPDHKCMTRIDHEGAWVKGNIEIVTRREHFKRQGELRMLTGRVRGPSKNKQAVK